MERQSGLFSLDLATARRAYAEDLAVITAIGGGAGGRRVVDAFATVPREDFCGPGPWRIIPARASATPYMSLDADPRWLCHNVLVTLDAQKGLNNGEPALWARIFVQLKLEEGERVLQVGAGAGYYSAILAHLVGQRGRVAAVEADPELADRARENLVDWNPVQVIAGDGAEQAGEDVFDAIVVFAGATHPASRWLDGLGPGGRLVLPLTGENGWGFLLLVTRVDDEFRALALGRCGFTPCMGLRDPSAATRITALCDAADASFDAIRRLHRGEPPAAAQDVILSLPGMWLCR